MKPSYRRLASGRAGWRRSSCQRCAWTSGPWCSSLFRWFSVRSGCPPRTPGRACRVTPPRRTLEHPAEPEPDRWWSALPSLVCQWLPEWSRRQVAPIQKILSALAACLAAVPSKTPRVAQRTLVRLPSTQSPGSSFGKFESCLEANDSFKTLLHCWKGTALFLLFPKFFSFLEIIRIECEYASACVQTFEAKLCCYNYTVNSIVLIKLNTNMYV